MLWLNRNRLTLIILSVVLSAFLALLHYVSVDRGYSDFSLEVVDSHPTLNIKKNSKFSFDHFDSDTQDFLTQSDVNSIKIIFSDNPTSQTLSEVTQTGELVEYTGSDVNTEGTQLTIDLFISFEGYQKLNKDEADAVIDSFQQILFSLSNLQQQKLSQIVTIDESTYKETLNEKQENASRRAKELVDRGLAPYTIKQN